MRRQMSAVDQGQHAVSPRAPLASFEDGPVTVQLAGEQAITANISALVHDPAQAPSRMERWLYGYASRAIAELWTDSHIRDRLLITAAIGYEGDSSIRATANRVQARLEELDTGLSPLVILLRPSMCISFR